ncbi:MAG: nicotinate-nucleotide--dimethylbenzimidazole phosphoribosyltransferase [Lachnospiraceae bacterium]|nr:nicotinate-nucleotide--dimethylbenzimidazole phosphoribosyltransferase [Lachnospiraceae bacterium]
MTLSEAINRILQPDREAMAACRAHWNSIGKPLYGLGKLEEYLVQIAGVQRTEKPDIRRKALVIFCADNGVVAEGVSQTGQEVTATVAENFIDGKSCSAIMCRRAGADLFPVDAGIAVDTPRLEKRKCRRGTRNMAKGPAMTREEAVFAIEAGIAKAMEMKAAGYGILAGGEMGIGNTTTSAAVVSVLLGAEPAAVTGRGAGLSDEGLETKIRVIRKAIELNQPDPEDPLDVLAKVGGFDIAALAGLFIGGASCGVPVVIDGFISAAAALLAVKIAPACREYMLPSHMSEEHASKMIMDALEMEPVIHAGMHLGEGTGAAALFPLLDMACDIYDQMDTFEGIAVEQYEDYGRK